MLFVVCWLFFQEVANGLYQRSVSPDLGLNYLHSLLEDDTSRQVQEREES